MRRMSAAMERRSRDEDEHADCSSEPWKRKKVRYRLRDHGGGYGLRAKQHADHGARS